MDFYEKSSKDEASASLPSHCWTFECRSKLDLYCGQVKLWMDSLFHVHMWKCAKSWIKVHHTKKDQFLFSYILICYAILSPLFLQNCVLFCCNPQYKLVLLLEKYLFLCKYPRGYFVSKCQDTVKKILMIFKDNNSNIHFIINYFNSWYKDGKDEYFISLFFHFKCFSQAEPFECLSCFSHVFRRVKLHAVLGADKDGSTLRERDDGIVQPSSTISTEITI